MERNINQWCLPYAPQPTGTEPPMALVSFFFAGGYPTHGATAVRALHHLLSPNLLYCSSEDLLSLDIEYLFMSATSTGV